MKGIVFIIVFFRLVNIGCAQELRLSKVIEGAFDVMTTDHIGRLYLAKSHELFLYSAEGELMYQFSDLSRGDIVHLDASNPMKILLFYPEYSQVTFLDNTLSKTRDYVDFAHLDLDLELAQLACASFDNGFWVYDPIDFSLVRFDQGLNVTNEVANVNQLVGAEISPTQIVETNNWLYLNDPIHGIFVFDSFGTYSKLIPIPKADYMQVRENGIFLLVENCLLKYDPLTFEISDIELPTDDYIAARIEKNRLYLLQDTAVLIFSNSQ
jgi:hypothetical protein